MFILTGRLHHKFDMVVKSEKFRKLEFILLVNYQRPKDDLIKFMATGSNCDIIDSIPIGTFMDVVFYVSGRLHTMPDGKEIYFTNLEVISINYHDIQYDEPKIQTFDRKELEQNETDLPF